MSSIRITKSMAELAALKMAEKAYNNKIKEAQEDIDSEVEKLVKKYIPAPVIACVNEYDKYFYGYTHANITTSKENPNGWNCREDSIYGNLTFKLPASIGMIEVSRNEYKDVRKLYDKKSSLVVDKDKFMDNIINALLSLKTYNKVKEQLPEAIKYIEVPSGTMLPAPIYTELNNLIAKIA